ncbi:hypothetical protein TALK_02710 [Thalassospira alkalitolerans]|uniref:Uncharacterized protein n=1 Tax=Thalassospira alkalitolerans TaxID=1293890 RepID=A0A1Y2LHP8_9PROT|nr:hypothetical protein TALK_02710 [Thalassospira alkalitolerans]
MGHFLVLARRVLIGAGGRSSPGNQGGEPFYGGNGSRPYRCQTDRQSHDHAICQKIAAGSCVL